jgi:hypothetical protein
MFRTRIGTVLIFPQTQNCFRSYVVMPFISRLDRILCLKYYVSLSTLKKGRGIEWFIEDLAFSSPYDYLPHSHHLPPPPPPTRQQVISLSQYSCVSPVELILIGDWREGDSLGVKRKPNLCKSFKTLWRMEFSASISDERSNTKK